MRTRVGYAGGTKPDPTYDDLGEHAEAVQVEYDPTQITYGELLGVFWHSHNPNAPSYGRQYSSMILYHNEEQRRLAEASKVAEAATTGGTIYTEILPGDTFHSAEQYHQKYFLQQAPELVLALRQLYPTDQEYVDATVVARLNGYVSGQRETDDLLEELVRLGLSREQGTRFLDLAR